MESWQEFCFCFVFILIPMIPMCNQGWEPVINKIMFLVRSSWKKQKQKTLIVSTPSLLPRESILHHVLPWSRCYWRCHTVALLVLLSTPHLLIPNSLLLSRAYLAPGTVHVSICTVCWLSYPEDWKLCEGVEGWDHCNTIHAQRLGLTPEVNQ